MKIKTLIYLLVLLVIYTGVFSQYNFDSITVSHDKDKSLKHIAAGEYEAQIQEARLIAFSTKDGLIKYDEVKRQFIIKNIRGDSSFQLQLSATGVNIANGDTSFIVSMPAWAKRLPDSVTRHIISESTVGNFSLEFAFDYGTVSKIRFDAGTRHFTIGVSKTRGGYSWDFVIEEKDHSNSLLLTYVYDKPYMFSIDDDANKVGIRLLSKKKNGVFTLIEGLKFYTEHNTYTDDSFKLQYTRSGRLRGEGISKFNLTYE